MPPARSGPRRAAFERAARPNAGRILVFSGCPSASPDTTTSSPCSSAQRAASAAGGGPLHRRPRRFPRLSAVAGLGRLQRFLLGQFFWAFARDFALAAAALVCAAVRGRHCATLLGIPLSASLRPRVPTSRCAWRTRPPAAQRMREPVLANPVLSMASACRVWLYDCAVGNGRVRRSAGRFAGLGSFRAGGRGGRAALACDRGAYAAPRAGQEAFDNPPARILVRPRLHADRTPQIRHGLASRFHAPARRCRRRNLLWRISLERNAEALCRGLGSGSEGRKRFHPDGARHGLSFTPTIGCNSNRLGG